MDTLASEPFAGLILLQIGMHLDLMCRGHDLGLLDQPLSLLAREVRDANRLGFPLLVHLFHRFPRVHVVGIAVDGLSLVVFGDHGVASAESDGPVHEVEVHVVHAEVLEGSIEGGFDVRGVVGVVPEFGGDEEGGAGDAGFLDGGAAGGFGAVSDVVVNLEDDLTERRQKGIGDGRETNMRAVSMCL